MTRTLGWLLLTAVVPLCSGCDAVSPRLCTLEARPAVSVEIRDAVTAAPLADSSTVRVTDGSVTDTLHLCGLTEDYRWLSRCGFEERPGTYDVRVTRSGYAPWSRSGVHVARDECHVQTAVLRATLTAAP